MKPPTHTQRGILGTAVIAFFVVAMFYVPWRVESTGDIAWAPFYRNPVMGRSVKIEETIESRFVRLKGQQIWWLHGVQLLSIAALGTVVYLKCGEDEEE